VTLWEHYLQHGTLPDDRPLYDLHGHWGPFYGIHMPASDDEIRLVHTPEYVAKLNQGTLSEREQIELEVPYSHALVEAVWLAAGGSILAADLALDARGVAMNIAGGFHTPSRATERALRHQ
jgi:acetoin utilization deacetylase AcuC-like enzyme